MGSCRDYLAKTDLEIVSNPPVAYAPGSPGAIPLHSCEATLTATELSKNGPGWPQRGRCFQSFLTGQESPHAVTNAATRAQPRNSLSSARLAWWRRPGSNRQPPACKAGALPVELRPRFLRFLSEWAYLDSNQGPQLYQSCALAN
jgi:hypothetical protein